MKSSHMAMLGGIVLSACTLTAAQAQVEMKAAAFLPEQVVLAKYFYHWARDTNERCADEVNISVVGPAAIPSLEQWNAVKTGVIDMYFGPANYYVGAVPEGDVFVVGHTSLAEQRENGAWEMINELHNEKLNSWYLTTINSGVQFYIYTTKPPKDGKLEGFRLRSVPLYDSFFEGLGAQPVRMAATEVQTGLERGTVDGYGWPLWGIDGFGLEKFTKYRIGPGFFSAASPVLVNLDKWNSLTDEQRQCLTESAQALEASWSEIRDKENAVQLEVQDAAGIEAVELSPDLPQQAEDGYWDKLSEANSDFIAAIKPLMTGN